MDELVTVWTTESDTEAVLYRALLEEAGIAVMDIAARNAWIIHMHIEAATPKHRLQVLAGDALRARQLIEAYRQSTQAGEFVLPEDTLSPTEADALALARRRRRRILFFGRFLLLLLLLVVLAAIFYDPIVNWLQRWGR